MTNSLTPVTGAEISLVIPIRNEAATLPQLLAAITAQTLEPRELVVVDSGSSDVSVALVEQWAMQNGYGKQRCRIIANPGGMPGANRNRGVAEAAGEWIAFLDGGIVPEPDWLARLCDCVGATGSKAVFGQCRFDADSVFEKAVCALSNGCGAVHPVLPASLFHRSVFERAGWFREDLRSAEDILWLGEVKRQYGPRIVCEEALVHYRHFPANVSAAVKKWCLYEQNSVHAGVRRGQRLFLTIVFLAILCGFVFMPLQGVILLLGYLLLRGLVDPVRRSRQIMWWKKQPAALLVALGLGIVLDGAKIVGSIAAWLDKPDGINTDANLDKATVEGFGEEWHCFDQSAMDEIEMRRIFEDYFSIFPWSKLSAGAVGVDVGCGSGRWALLMAGKVGHLHLLDASEKALDVARRRLAGHTNTHFHLASVGDMPFGDGTLDFAYSLGVLHHVPDTSAAIKAVGRKLKPGAPFLIYLYYAFDSQPLWFRAIWKCSDFLRRIISRLPFPARYLISQGIAVTVYWPLARLGKALDRAGFLPDAWPLRYYRDKSFYVMRTDALDRFGTRLEKRFSRVQIQEMLEAAGFREIRFSDAQPHWCALGVKATHV